MKLKRLLGIKKKQKGNKIKHYFLGLHLWKIKYCPNKIKVYFLGLRVLSFPKEVVTIVQIQKGAPTDSLDALHLKALEIISERKDCTYNPKENA